jgi:hypothetical protein
VLLVRHDQALVIQLGPPACKSSHGQ